MRHEDAAVLEVKNLSKTFREKGKLSMEFRSAEALTQTQTERLKAAVLNKLRALVRQTELAGARAVPDRVDIIRALNRLSSCMHILFCRFLVGQYGSK